MAELESIGSELYSNGELVVTGNNTTGKNYFINGGLDVWQRGETFTTSGYGPDRWRLGNGGGTMNCAKQDSLQGKYILMSYENAATYGFMAQRVEGLALCGKTVTMSFGTTVDVDMVMEVSITVYEGSTETSKVTKTIQVPANTNFTRYSETFTIGDRTDDTTYNDSNIYCVISFYDTDGVSPVPDGTIRFQQLQLEEGTVATQFEILPIGTTLTQCYRYFYTTESNPHPNMSGTNCAIAEPIRAAGAGFPTRLKLGMALPVEMRATPTVDIGCYSAGIGNVALWNNNNDYRTVTGVSGPTAKTVGTWINLDTNTDDSAFSFNYRADAEFD